MLPVDGHVHGLADPESLKGGRVQLSRDSSCSAPASVDKIAPGRVGRKMAVFRRGDQEHVEAAGLELQHRGEVFRDDAVDDAVQFRSAVEVIFPGFKDQVLTVLPFLEDIGAAPAGWVPKSWPRRSTSSRGTT